MHDYVEEISGEKKLLFSFWSSRLVYLCLMDTPLIFESVLLLGSVWIISGPILIFMIVGLLDAWVRESVVYIVNAFISFG